MLLALVVWPLTTHLFRDGAPFLLLVETPPTFGRSVRVFCILHRSFCLCFLLPPSRSVEMTGGAERGGACVARLTSLIRLPGPYTKRQGHSKRCSPASARFLFSRYTPSDSSYFDAAEFHQTINLRPPPIPSSLAIVAGGYLTRPEIMHFTVPSPPLP